MSELEEQLFQAPEEWFEVHLLGGELECTHLTKEGIQALLSLYQKELVRELRDIDSFHSDDILRSIVRGRISQLTGEQP